MTWPQSILPWSVANVENYWSLWNELFRSGLPLFSPNYMSFWGQFLNICNGFLGGQSADDLVVFPLFTDVEIKQEGSKMEDSISDIRSQREMYCSSEVFSSLQWWWSTSYSATSESKHCFLYKAHNHKGAIGVLWQWSKKERPGKVLVEVSRHSDPCALWAQKQLSWCEWLLFHATCSQSTHSGHPKVWTTLKGPDLSKGKVQVSLVPF